MWTLSDKWGLTDVLIQLIRLWQLIEPRADLNEGPFAVVSSMGESGRSPASPSTKRLVTVAPAPLLATFGTSPVHGPPQLVALYGNRRDRPHKLTHNGEGTKDNGD